MIRRPPRSTLDRSSAASDVYKRQDVGFGKKLVFINAGTGGKDLPDIIDPNASYWSRIKKILDSNFVTASQIQIVFLH